MPVEAPRVTPLADPARLRGDFLDRQKIIATYGGRSMSFDAVLQKRGDALTLLGLTPFGSRAFVLTQKGTEVSFQAFVPEGLPFPPRYVLVDVQRVFFPVEGMNVQEGSNRVARDGEVVTEMRHAGHLVRRTFARLDGHPPGEIVVEYEGGSGVDDPPVHVVLTNGWYGYRLDIRTVSHKRLDVRED